MITSKPKICDKTKKVMLSEPQAVRKVQNYQDIKRYYKCKFCGLFHITYIGYGALVKKGLEYQELEKAATVKPGTITNRLNWLKKRINKF